ncbi:MAG: hypothetical protein WCD70_03305 [Alphaproteobacteria bacterium]
MARARSRKHAKMISMKTRDAKPVEHRFLSALIAVVIILAITLVGTGLASAFGTIP